MTPEAPSPPVAEHDDERLGVCKKPRQFQPYWLEFMEPLPSQIRRPLRDALNPKLSAKRRAARLVQARRTLHIYAGDLGEWFESVDQMMDKRGVEYVDPSNAAQADAFVARLGDSGRRALDKRQRIRTAIAYARMTIDWVEWELTHGD
jgi:hypothetical protein